MTESLSIRAYSKQPKSHSHPFYQLVLPLQGAIVLNVVEFNGKVVPGEGIIIRSGETHCFTAEEQARFIVADLHALPHAMPTAARLFALDVAFKAYLRFIENQLQLSSDPHLQQQMLALFKMLLSKVQPKVITDKRLADVLLTIQSQLQSELTITTLAQMACLSPTQFKKIFTAHTGQAPAAYITAKRMEQARALLTNTDLPVQQVAEQVGYRDISAFSRRFSQYFGLSPRQLKR